jgi:hypothetical protein
MRVGDRLLAPGGDDLTVTGIDTGFMGRSHLIPLVDAR